MCDLAMGLAKNLRPCSLVVRSWIIRIGKLVQHLALAFSLHLFRKIAGALHAFLLRDH